MNRDYLLGEACLEENHLYRAYPARRRDSGRPCVVKVLKSRYPSPSAIALFNRECKIIQGLQLEGIVDTIDLVDVDDKLAVVTAPFSGETIQSLNPSKADVRQLLGVVIKVASTLDALHRHNIVFKDIAADNVCIDQVSGEVKLANFGVASILSESGQGAGLMNMSKERLLYLSPEQTGRMNLPVDFRSDLYSLGAVFYRLLSGEAPYTGEEPLEIIHAHLAKDVLPLHQVYPDVPVVLSRIVMKLLAKNPDDRYQGAAALIADLRTCHQQLIQYGRIEDFEIARQDIPIKFILPKRLAGRDREKQLLLSIFDKVKTGANEVVWVIGEEGVGKTALIREIVAELAEKKVCVISDKCDPFQDSPYHVVIRAFSSLVRQILTENEDGIRRWRKKMLEAFGRNGKLMIDVIPELEFIIGRQPDMGEMSAGERFALFVIVARNLIKVFASEAHPMVLFLDDMQWVDRATLNLIADIDCDIRYFFFIGAYRDREVDDLHPLMTQSRLATRQKDNHMIILNGLDEDETRTLVRDFLKCPDPAAAPLASLVWKKTAGNPFFINQWIKNLYETGLLNLEPGLGWRWDLEKISAVQAADNVLAMLAGKFAQLPARVKETLQICACMGSFFDLDRLAMIVPGPAGKTMEDLRAASEAGIITLTGKQGWFQDDHIMETVYTSLPLPRRQALHYRIGKVFLSAVDADGRQDHIFYMVDQFNNGLSLVTDSTERLDLARLNLQAGLKAKEASAFAAALRYFACGASLLPEDSWNIHYQLTLQLKKERATYEYRVGNHDMAQRLFDEIDRNARTDYDRANVYAVRTLLLTNKGLYDQAIALGLSGLELLDRCVLPRNPGRAAVVMESWRLRFQLRGKTNEYFADLPVNESREITCAVQIIESLIQAVMYTNARLMAQMAMRGMSTIIKCGHTFISPHITALMVPILTFRFNDADAGRRFIALSTTLMERIHKREEGHTYFILACFAVHWHQHARNGVDLFRKAYHDLRAEGAFNFACHSLGGMIDYSFMIGRNLDESFLEYQQHEDFVRNMKDAFFMDHFRDIIRAYDCLQGRTDSPASLNRGDAYENDRFNMIEERNNSLDAYIFVCNKMKLLYLAGRSEDAYHLAQGFVDRIEEPLGILHVPEFVFFHALCAAAAYPAMEPSQWKPAGLLLQKASGRMKKWADHCPENFLHKFLLIEAERRRMDGWHDEAVTLYEEAIRAAAESKYVNNEAIIAERLAEYLFSLSRPDEGAAMICRAHACFKLWGATAKMRYLEMTYAPHFAHLNNAMFCPEDNERRKHASLSIDLAEVIRVSQTIAEEIQYPRLIEKTLRFLLEIAAARRGVMIIRNKGRLFVEAEDEAGSDRVSILPSLSIEEHGELPASVIYSVARTKETVCLRDAAFEGGFIHDPYICATRPKSILCCPIVSKGDLMGLVYLENKHTAGVFTSDRIEVIHLLSSQIAISVENARCYGELEKKVEERANDLQETMEVLSQEANRRKCVEDELRLSHYRLARVLDNTSDTIIVMNVNREIVFFNKGAENLFLYGAEQIAMQPVTCLFLPKSYAVLEERLRLMASSEGVDTNKEIFGLDVKSADGALFKANAHLSAFEVNDEPHYSVILRPAAENESEEGEYASLEEGSMSVIREMAEDMNPSGADFTERFMVLESAIKNISVQFNPQNQKEQELREKTVKVMIRVLALWESRMKKMKVDLAQESGIWTAYCDRGTWRTRTLDKYLSPDALPKHPRYDDVLKTADFVLKRYGEKTTEYLEICEMVDDLRNLLSSTDVAPQPMPETVSAKESA